MIVWPPLDNRRLGRTDDSDLILHECHDLVYQGYDRLENEKTAEIDGLEYLKYDRENY